MKIQRYKHDSLCSYALGMTLTMELLLKKPEAARTVYISPEIEKNRNYDAMDALCRDKHIPIVTSEKAFNILSPKGNCFVIGVFEKFEERLSDGNHVVLVEPSDAGNLGTIIRTATGFGLKDLAIIRMSAVSGTETGLTDQNAPAGKTGEANRRTAVDIFDPKVVRASMGAIFRIRFAYFDTFEDYQTAYPARHGYPFMLQKTSRSIHDVTFEEPFSLIFGNEATGLPDSFAELPGLQPVIIPHSNEIDSLNLSMAAGIGMYEATKKT
ncbi:MAG: TrmH family RNA methyltransferase [Lachnospiraceae bacterium]|nr:TrmH family RNA methyltransferase [Lachnospiraceae bacterium]